MSDFRYEQFCPIARATELLASRWTLLILRDLTARGDLRFADLQKSLPGISPSVLSERMRHLEDNGIVARRALPPPAASTVYRLTEVGHALRPALIEFLRWGLRFMPASQPEDHFEPAWLPMGIEAIARSEPTPAMRVLLLLRADPAPIPVLVVGGADGTRVESPAPVGAEVDVTLDSDARAVVLIAAKVLSLDQAEAAGLVRVEGDASLLGNFPELFEMPTPPNLS
jgi:DNA-binding HxlR family transcriptional regulator